MAYIPSRIRTLWMFDDELIPSIPTSHEGQADSTIEDCGLEELVDGAVPPFGPTFG